MNGRTFLTEEVIELNYLEAVKEDKSSIVNFYLTKGLVNHNVVDPESLDPDIFVALNHKAYKVLALLSLHPEHRDAVFGDKRETVAHRAARFIDEKAIKILARSGFDFTRKNSEGVLPEKICESLGKPILARYLHTAYIRQAKFNKS